MANHKTQCELMYDRARALSLSFDDGAVDSGSLVSAVKANLLVEFPWVSTELVTDAAVQGVMVTVF
jgi:hypothetical protein